jgi:hypothetical protein
VYLLAHCSGIFKTGRWAHLDNLALDAELTNLWIRGFYKDFRADNTVRQHSYAFNSFCKWCFSHNIVNILPFSDVYVAMYLVHLPTKGKSVSTLRPTMIYAGHINLQALLIIVCLTLLYQ